MTQKRAAVVVGSVVVLVAVLVLSNRIRSRPQPSRSPSISRLESTPTRATLAPQLSPTPLDTRCLPRPLVPNLDAAETSDAPRLLALWGSSRPEARALIERSSEVVRFPHIASSIQVHYGGSTENSPEPQIGLSYTVGRTIYTPKSHTDPVIQIEDLLYEVSNALQAGTQAGAYDGAYSGAIDSEAFVKQSLQVEAHSTLLTAQLWMDLAPTLPVEYRGKIPEYSQDFHVSEYLAVASYRASIDQLADGIGNTVITEGAYAGLTLRQLYAHGYDRIREDAAAGR